MKKQILSEEFQRMQKLAGLITESQYKQKFLNELQYFHNGTRMNQIINYDDADITDDLEALGMGSMDGQDFKPGETYDIGGKEYKVEAQGNEFKLVLAQLNEADFIDKTRAFFGGELKTPEFDTKKIDGKTLNSDQKDVKNKIIMILKDMNKGKNPNNYYFTEISVIDLLDKGLKISTHTNLDSDLEEKLKKEKLNVSAKKIWRDYKQFDSDLNREVEKSTYHTIMDVTKK